ncbi:MAG TPA: methyltransferase domain-containing protein, partial [Anaerolineae bacterium]
MTYSESYFTARETWRDWRIEARHMLDLARVSKGTRVLEIGCGGGGLLRLLSGRGAGVVGVDTSPVALELARGRNAPEGRLREVIRIGVEDALPFRDGSFDVIVGQHVVEHLTDIGAALCEWNRLLKPGGRLALATPNSRYPDRGHFADANHTHVLSPRELSDAVDRAGFAVQAAYTMFPFLSRVRVLRGLGVLGHRFFLH